MNTKCSIMKRVRETRKASHSSPEDVISKMPENVITNIMDRLPIQDAARTCILSTNWRYNWTLLRQLVFDFQFFDNLLLKNGGKYYGKIISRLLLHLKGVITTFVLYISDESELDDEDINHWLLFLSRIRIKNLPIRDLREDLMKLPTHFFSCLELKHLRLYNCRLRPTTSFHGFPNLFCLDLNQVIFENYRCEEFLTRSLLLKVLKICYHTTFNMKLDEIAKLELLKVLSFPLCKLDNTEIITSSKIFHLIGLLPKLQKVKLDFSNCKVRFSCTFFIVIVLRCVTY